MLRGFSVSNGGTDQSLYVLSPLGIFETDQFVAAGSSTTRVTNVTPGRDDAGEPLTLAVDDVVVAINRYSQFERLTVDSVSGDVVTWQTGPSADLLHRCLLRDVGDDTNHAHCLLFCAELGGAHPPSTRELFRCLHMGPNRALWVMGPRIPRSANAPTRLPA